MDATRGQAPRGSAGRPKLDRSGGRPGMRRMNFTSIPHLEFARSAFVRSAALAALACFVLPALPAAASPIADPRPRDAYSAGETRAALRRLQVTGTLLYIGAHPDDDNTSLLACLARQRMVRTVYLSLTRGDGGQNILGSEQGDALGVIRTQELLASRRVDGAEQTFGRELDFGFSKNPTEALAIWGHDRALADVVWAIRRYRPDVIVTRFGTDGSGGHGHHTASAMLAGEAFRAAADSTRFPEQLKTVAPWQARRLLWNTWAPKIDGRDPKSPPLIKLDAGTFDPVLGLSYTEIGGRARSLNRSQGAGTTERRGAQIEYFEPVDGDPAQSDLFDGVDVSWLRIPGSDEAAAALHTAETQFDPDHPELILPQLAHAHALLSALPDEPIVAQKLRELADVVRSCAGLWLEAIAASPTISPHDTLALNVTAIDRAGAAVTIDSIELPWKFSATFAVAKPETAGAPAWNAAEPVQGTSGWRATSGRALGANQPLTTSTRMVVPDGTPFTQPYWLKQPALAGSFEVPNALQIGDAESAPAVTARVTLTIAGEKFAYDVPAAYRWTDRVYGDRYRSLEVLPPVTCQLDHSVYLFSGTAKREVRLAVQSTRAALDGVAKLRLPAGWSAEPAEQPVHIDAGAEEVVLFRVTPGGSADAATLAADVVVAGRTYSSRLTRIDYPHIPIQTLLPPCEARLVRADVRHKGTTIAYLMGSGDQVPEALDQMGFGVALLSDDDVENADLSQFDCIVAGVRAYNTRPRLRVLQPRLLEYVRNGGRLVIQYNTPEEALNDRLGPWPFKLTRDRVTVETAEMRVLQPKHPLLNVPNVITSRDFDGWVQERGLYFASPWDERYQTVLSANDPGEPARDGGTLYANYGKGQFVFTALAWFRQLPAGVPGAWRLFANLVSKP
jgi:LmbE family N-acetylglucosaminyl deacetylase